LEYILTEGGVSRSLLALYSQEQVGRRETPPFSIPLTRVSPSV